MNHNPGATMHTARFQPIGILLVLAVVLFCTTASAQDLKQVRSRIDSLERALTVVGLPDTARIAAMKSLAAALNKFAEIHILRGEPGSMQEPLERSLRLREEAKDSMGIGFSLHWLGRLYQDLEDKDKAWRYFDRSLALREKIGDKRGAAYTLLNMGTLHAGVGEYRNAIACFERSLALATEIRNLDGMAAAGTNLGSVLTSVGDYDSALKRLIEALAVHEQIGEKGGIANAVTNIGNIHLQRKRFELAMQYYERAVKLREEIDDRAGLSKALNNIGVIHLKSGRLDDALQYFNRCLAIREALGDKAGAINVTSNIGLIHKNRNDHAMALMYFEKCLAFQTVLGDRDGMAASHINIGSAQAALGMHAKAIASLECGLNLAQETGHREWIRNALLALSDTYAESGDYKQAYTFERKFEAIRDSLLNEAHARMMEELTIKYESEQKERRIAVLERDRVKQTADLESERQARALRDFEARNLRQGNILLRKEHELQRIELDRSAKEIELRDAELRLGAAEKRDREKRLALLGKDNELKASVVSRETLLRNGLLALVGFLFVTMFLGYKRYQATRVQATLRAQSAELEARARKAETLAVLSESERRRKEDMERFAHRLIELQEEERSRIARELHDSLGQELLVIRNQMHMALQEVGQVEKLSDRLNDVKEMSLSVLEEIRLLSRNLRPVQLERSGLTKTVREMLRHIEETGAIAIEAFVEEVDGLFAQEQEINVYRILQECLTNAVKHASAETVSVSVRRSNGDVRMLVADDGCGFDATKMLSNPASEGMGLRSIQERVQILHGRMDIRSSEGQGTVVDVVLPVRPEARVKSTEAA